MNARASALAMLGCGLLGIAIGYTIGLRVPADAARAAPPPGAHGEGRATPSRPRTHAYRAQDAGTDAGQGDTHRTAVERARRDPAYLRTLLGRFRGETSADRKAALLAILQGVGSDAVLQEAAAWAASADTSARADGLALLGGFPIAREEVRELLLRRLGEERDPALLRTLADMATPAVLPAEDSARLADGLRTLTTHADPGLRAAGLTQLAQWDRSPGLEERLHAALSDPSAEVRDAAIVGVGIGQARSERLKRALLAVLSDPDVSAQTRHSALFALQGFSLDRREYEIYRMASELSTLEEGPGH